MTNTDIIFSPALDRYIEIRYEKDLSSIRFIKSRELSLKKTLKASFELDEYFRGERKKFSCNVDLSGMSDFTQKILEETQEIEYGAVITYSELARRIGTKAVRAVGGALSRNPVPIIVPCHRVVAKDGLGGYSCGLDLKIKLLELERKHLSNNL